MTVFQDTSESMNAFNTRETAIKAAATFTYSALADYDTVSTVLFKDGIGKFSHNLRGTKSFNRLVADLEDYSFGGESDLFKAVYPWQNKLRKGITVIISDLMFDHQIEKVIRLLAYKKQRVVLCHVLAEEEINPTFDENVMLVDSESGETMDIDTGYEAVNLYKQKLQDYVNEIKGVCSRYKVDYMLINTKDPFEGFIKHIQSIS